MKGSSGGLRARDVAAKLRLTAAALGLSGQKELCAAFRRANPATGFDLERSYKWVQGRATPRDAGVFADWAMVCGLGRPGAWVAASSLEEFTTLLAARHGLDPEVLRRRAGLDGEAPPTWAAAPAGRDERYLAGSYACFSLAQSPYYAGRIIRGAVALEEAAVPGGPAALAARCEQALPSGMASLAGPALVGAGRALTLALHAQCSAGTSPLCFSLVLPAPPASLLAGIMTGFTMIDPAGQPPYATRVAMVRVPAPSAAVASSGGYMEAAPAAIARDLAAQGLAGSGGRELGALLLAFLRAGAGGGTIRLPAEEHAALAAACDRAWLDTLAARAA
ncbi:hypothetical protein ACI6QG_06715 [Roseococcus sp. DSY-14]|uniref:hypothetical protein n=1 Tax=Roseococcus sp. DSY-14 TaxID=3369650 RepID=UPI00387B569E